MNRLRADALLVLAAFIWGTAFIAQKQANESMGPILFVGLRFTLTALVVAPLALREARRATTPLTRRESLQAAGIGVGLFAGSVLQQVGLVTTTATKGGFLTAVYLVMVPFAAWLTARTPLRPVILLACAVSLAGAFLLAGNIDLRAWSPGDLTVLLADVAWAFQITQVSRFLERSHRPFFLAFAQAGITGLLAIVLGLTLEQVSLTGIESAGVSLLYAGLCSGGIAFTIQVVSQRYTPAAEASLLMSLESVFAAAAGAYFFHDRLDARGLLGCALILAGAVGVELYPSVLAKMRRSEHPEKY
jgi:drug/metabolite transporter (DMT)-like permease